jgi:hypothetical protein
MEDVALGVGPELNECVGAHPYQNAPPKPCESLARAGFAGGAPAVRDEAAAGYTRIPGLSRGEVSVRAFRKESLLECVPDAISEWLT